MLEMLTSYDEKEYYEGLKEDFREEGRAEGIAQEKINTERERKRADKAENRANVAEEELAKYKAKFGGLV